MVMMKMMMTQCDVRTYKGIIYPVFLCINNMNVFDNVSIIKE